MWTLFLYCLGSTTLWNPRPMPPADRVSQTYGPFRPLIGRSSRSLQELLKPLRVCAVNDDVGDLHVRIGHGHVYTTNRSSCPSSPGRSVTLQGTTG